MAVVPGCLLMGKAGPHTLPGVNARVHVHLFQGIQLRRWAGEGTIGQADLIVASPPWWPENPVLALWQATMGTGVGDVMAYGLLVLLGWWGLGLGIAGLAERLALGRTGALVVGFVVQLVAWPGIKEGQLGLLGLGLLAWLLAVPRSLPVRGLGGLVLLSWWWPWPMDGALQNDERMPAYVGDNLAVFPSPPEMGSEVIDPASAEGAVTVLRPNGVEATLRGMPGSAVVALPNPAWGGGKASVAEWLVRADRHGHPVDLDMGGGNAPALQATLARELNLPVSTQLAALAWRDREGDPLALARAAGVAALWVHRAALDPDVALRLDRWVAQRRLGPVVQDDGWMVVGLSDATR